MRLRQCVGKHGGSTSSTVVRRAPLGSYNNLSFFRVWHVGIL